MPRKQKPNLTAGLNPEQARAVTTTKGPLLVLAGAGTGKTRVITVRIGQLIAEGVNPEHILAVTFTNKAAREMGERVAKIVGKQNAEALTVGTFHAFCLRVLKEFRKQAGYPRGFSISDTSDQLSAIKGALRELRIAETHLNPRVALSRISLLKNRCITSEAFLASASDDSEELLGRAYQRYVEQLRRSRSMDFDDLLLNTVKLLEEHPDVTAKLRDRHRYALIDEYQDTNGVQYEVVRQIAGEHRNLCVVGDDDQSIYGWRGADVTKILNFEKDFPGAAVVRLERNYRSTRPILRAANRVISNNPDRHEKALVSEYGDGDHVRILEVEDEETEAVRIVREINYRVNEEEARLGDYAILFRTGVQPRVFESELRARGVPYTLIGGPSYFDRKEVRDVLAYLRLIANPDDEASFLRAVGAPPRGVGKSSLDRALAFASAEGISITAAFERADEIEKLRPEASDAARDFMKLIHSLGSKDPGRQLVPFIDRVLDAVGYRSEVDRIYEDPKERSDRWSAVEELSNLAENYLRRAKKPTLAKFLEKVTLSGNDDESPEDASERDRLTLMTLHASKGLEFPRVYLVGLEEGLLPHQRAVDEDTIEEERRLMYVGITRAQRHLVVSLCKSRAKFGTRVLMSPSRFLFEMRGDAPPPGWQPALRSDQREAEKTVARKKRSTKKRAKRVRR